MSPMPRSLSCTALLITLAGLAAVVGVACGGKAIIDPGGSGGASSTSSSGTSTSGTGGAECTVVTDCPSPSSVCEAPVCIGGHCGTVGLPAGTVCGEPGAGVCDGTGTCVDLCTELCFDFVYCVNEPADECIANCHNEIVNCPTADRETLFGCHVAFDLDCTKLMDLSDCVNAVGCVGP